MYLEKDKLLPLYKIAKEKSDQQNSEVVFSFTQEIKLENNILSLIDIKFKTAKVISYWNQKTKESQFLSFGEIISFSTDKLDKSVINLNIEKIIQDSIQINETNQKDIPFFIGGQNFNISKKNSDIWKDYKSANYQIPEMLILKNDSLTTITSFALMDNNKSFDCMYSKFSDYYKIITNHINGTKKSKIIFKSKKIKVNKNKFINQISEIKEMIQQAKVDKVVLSNIYRYTIKKEESYAFLLKSIEKKYPECTIFYFDYLNEGKFLGASPELVLKNSNNQIEIDALAGSINNGKTQSEQIENEKKII